MNPTKSMKLARLLPHPEQSRFFGWHSEADYQALLNDIEQNGLQHPPEVMPPKNAAGLPAGTIIKGHQRKEAMLELGYKDVTVIVRMDLIDADAATVTGLLIADNLARRQLHPLEKARAVVGLLEAEKKRAPGTIDPSHSTEARERVGAALGMSGRHLVRLCRILTLPDAIQRAVRDGHLPMLLAEKLTGMGREVQSEIAGTVARAKDASAIKAIVAAYVPPPQPQPRNATQVFELFIRAVGPLLPRLDGQSKNIYRRAVHDRISELHLLRTITEELIDSANKYDGVPAETLLAKMAADLGRSATTVGTGTPAGGA